MNIIFACTVFHISSDLQFKSEFFEEIQLNELNLIVIDRDGSGYLFGCQIFCLLSSIMNK
jgi:hypothetical protein